MKLGMIKKYFENLKSNTTESIISNYCMAYLLYYGHSLDVTDKDVLSKLILMKNTKTHIFYGM